MSGSSGLFYGNRLWASRAYVVMMTYFSMPRTSERQRAIARARRMFWCFVRGSALSGANLEGEEEDTSSDSDSSVSSSSSVLQCLLSWSFMRLRRKERSRYEARMPYRSHKYANPQYERDLLGDNHDQDKVPWLNKTDFLRKYQMPREAFNELLQ
eukprot:scaffold2144_cov98-Amphora_coffeaeformis.AAC.2